MTCSYSIPVTEKTAFIRLESWKAGRLQWNEFFTSRLECILQVGWWLPTVSLQQINRDSIKTAEADIDQRLKRLMSKRLS